MSLNVLLVNYTFPPVGGVNVLRVASLARYLPSHGIRVDVLTTRNPSSVGTDPSLLKDIPDEVTVHRTMTLDLPFGIKKMIKRLLTGSRPPTEQAPKDAPAGKPNPLKRVIQDALLPDPQVTWVPILTRTAHRIVRERKIDLVLISCAPFSTLHLAETLRKQFPVCPSFWTFAMSGCRPRSMWQASTSAAPSALEPFPSRPKRVPLPAPLPSFRLLTRLGERFDRAIRRSPNRNFNIFPTDLMQRACLTPQLLLARVRTRELSSPM